ncbi:ComEC/Rec2 family competence protein [Oceaniglobus roseus]|uniref:ComEC/Rec2 family competence protein n=1 Tax=Oceaniglobus roseus TaxID=1737570 RepID=UPI000C7F65C0|nr:ComEC/Rec2 family competence protein [Kandeliimicrobium roseum]
MAPLTRLAGWIDAQRGGLFPWVPVCLAIGIGCYFSLPAEPSAAIWVGLSATTLALVAGLARTGPARRPLLSALALVAAGVLLAGARAHLVAAPVLPFRYYGSVEGRILGIDRSASDAVRLTLDRVVLDDVAPARTPSRVRISLHSDVAGTVPVPGKRVMLTAHLAPPAGPVEPGGFDFQRSAWFDGLGAVGYSRTPLMAVALPPSRPSLARWRDTVAGSVRRDLPGEAGAFAAAITTGDRAAIPLATLVDLRASNLAHLLAISGLHMGLLTGVVFTAVRLALAAVPGAGLAWPIKKIAAVFALAAGAVYLGLSGGNVATQRAFVMVAVMFGAILLDRRALTLRAVAMAAIIVLVLRPESLTEPGFQMSFAATTALVAVFRALRGVEAPWLPRLLRPVLTVVLSSAVAGAATAPVAAAHFNTLSHYGLIANLLSVPLMGTVVMPGAVLAACLAPLGLEQVGLAVMAPAIRWILGVAHWIAAQPGAVGRVVAPGPAVLPLMSLGLLWVMVWRGPARLAGLAPAALALGLWSQAERPALLVSDSGGLVGVMTPAGRALSKERGEGFVAMSWLENDGDGAPQDRAAGRGAFRREGGLTLFRIGEVEVAQIGGRGAGERLTEGCARASLVILAARTTAAPPEGCRVIDRASLSRSGALAVRAMPGGLDITTAREASGERLWNRHPRRPRSGSGG